MSQYFTAPWGLKLKAVTAVFGLLSLVALLAAGPGVVVGLLVVAIVAALFMVRGYGVGDGRLTIHRLGWRVQYDLRNLADAEIVGGGLPGSIRVLGIGGLFSFAGTFWHPGEGWYKAYATDGTKAVLLDFGDQKIVVTPDSPQEFAAAVRLHRHFEDPGE